MTAMQMGMRILKARELAKALDGEGLFRGERENDIQVRNNSRWIHSRPASKETLFAREY